MTAQARPQESLSQALVAVLQGQLVAFLVLWLAVGFPVTCQVHGTMSMYELESHEHMGHGEATNTEFPCSLSDHSAGPSMSMLLSLITSMVPAPTLCQYSPTGETLLLSVIRWPLQLTALPVEYPPRSVSSV